jgi:hypothetical protein
MEAILVSETHPKYPMWRSAHDKLTDTQEAFEQGRATQRDLDNAKAELEMVSRSIDNA